MVKITAPWLKTLSLAGLASLFCCAVITRPAAAAVYLEDSPAALQLAEEAGELQAQGRLGEAAQKLQDIVEGYADKLMPLDETGYTDARRWVRQRLAVDPALLEAYRRRYAAVAERALNEAAAAPPRQRVALTLEIVDRYPLTSANLDAAFQLAGRYLERADAAGAAAMLSAVSSHPDRAAAEAQYQQLRAWTAALSGDAEGRDAALAEWAKLAGAANVDPWRQELIGLTNAMAKDSGPTPAVQAVALDRPLWQISIESPIQNQQVAQPRVVRNEAGGTEELRPVASGEMLLINDNLRVYAIDRISGRLRWAHRYETMDDAAALRNAGLVGRRVIEDKRQVLVRGEDVYAVLGFAVPWQGRLRRQAIDPTQLVSLDRDTGQVRWSVTPSQLDPQLERAAFHGTPVASGGQIIVMARRSQASSFQDSYLFSIDAATGELRWRRHLASTAGPTRRNVLPAMSSMTLDRGTIYLCDNLGAVAAVDARTGGVRWVRVLLTEQVDDRGRPQGLAIPFSDVARPQRVAAGLIVPMRINAARGLLLEPETGRVIEEFKSDSPLASAYDLAKLADGDLLIIGSQLSRLAGDTLEPRWVTSISPTNVEGITPRVSLRPGMAMVARQSVGLQLIELDGGQLVREVELLWTGGVLATGDAWVVTSGRKLAGYLDWSLAYDTLRQRAEDLPGSPEPGLNMAMLAINAGQPEAIDEGVDRALRALAVDFNRRERDPEAWREQRQQVFGELLDLTERDDLIDPAVVDRLFDRLAVTTETPAELLAYNLARGDFLSVAERPAEAVEFYQAILLDPQQASENLVRGSTSRRGDIAARLRLLQLGDTVEVDFYNRFDRLAESELATLLASPDTPVEAFLSLARRYPLAQVGGEAIFAAAQRQARSSNPVGAATQYRRAFQLAGDNGLRQRVAGALADYYESAGRPDAAARWLEQVARDHPGLTPLRRGEPTDLVDWLAELRRSPEHRQQWPSLTPPFASTIRLQGQLVPRANTANTPTRPGGLLYISGEAGRSIFGNTKPRQLTFYDLETRKHRWQSSLSPDGWRLVDQGIDNLLLWMPTAKQLVAISAATGEPLWTPLAAEPLLEDMGEGGLADSRRANAGGLLSVIEADFGPLEQPAAVRGGFGQAAGRSITPPPSVVASEAVVAVVDAKGRAFGLDRSSGLVLWQSALPVDAVTHAEVIDDVLAVAGTVSPGTEAQSARLLLVDLATGRLRFPPVENNDPALGLLFTPTGDPLVFTRTHLIRYDRRDGGLRWRLPLTNFNGLPQIVLAGDTAFIYGRSRLLSIDLVRGEVQAQGPSLLNRSSGPDVTLGRDQTLYNLHAEGSVAFDANLKVRWHDGLASLPKRLVTQTLGERHVFMFERYAGPEGPPGLRLSALDRDSGRLVAHTMLTNLGQAGELTTVELLNDHLLIAGRNDIALIPGTTAPDANPDETPGNHGNPAPETISTQP